MKKTAKIGGFYLRSSAAKKLFLIPSETDLGIFIHLLWGPGWIEDEIDFRFFHTVDFHEAILDVFLYDRKQRAADRGESHGDERDALLGYRDFVDESEIPNGNTELGIHDKLEFLDDSGTEFGLRFFHNFLKAQISKHKSQTITVSKFQNTDGI
mgnify:FL=1